MHILLDLFLTFMRIGAFTFGGGYAMISLITSKCVEEKQWLTHEEMMNLTDKDITAVVDFTGAEAGTATYKTSIIFSEPFTNVGALKTHSVSATVVQTEGE